MLKNLERCAVKQSPINDKLIGYIDFIQENLWRDAGIESQHQLERCIQLFTANRTKHQGYLDIAKRLIYMATEVNSPEKRQIQVDYLFELAHSSWMEGLIAEFGDEGVNNIINGFPRSLIKMFDNNPQEYVGKLWYLGCSYKKFRMLQTVMAMRIAMIDKDKNFTDDIDNVLIGGKKTFDLLSAVVKKYYKGLKKNLALIYCVMRDKGLLVNENNYRGFVELLVARNLLPSMNKNEIRTFAYSFGQYMRDKTDHGKVRKGFYGNYMEWENDNEKEFYEVVATYFTKQHQK